MDSNSGRAYVHKEGSGFADLPPCPTEVYTMSLKEIILSRDLAMITHGAKILMT